MGIIISIIPIVLFIICFAKESKVTGLYKTFGVYGRLAEYLTTCCMMGPVAMIATIISYKSDSAAGENNIQTLLLQIAVCLVLGFIGWGNFFRMRSKCPTFLRGKLLFALIITTFGVAFKVCLFFVGAVWKLTAPQDVILGNGQQGFVYNGEVYTQDGNHVGSMTDANTFTPNSNYIRDND